MPFKASEANKLCKFKAPTKFQATENVKEKSNLKETFTPALNKLDIINSPDMGGVVRPSMWSLLNRVRLGCYFCQDSASTLFVPLILLLWNCPRSGHYVVNQFLVDL